MNRTKRQHYSPQAYLSNFADGRGHIMVYDRLRQATYQTHIRNAAVENDLYTIIDADEPRCASRCPGSLVMSHNLLQILRGRRRRPWTTT
jgi:hypothetical protein